MRFMLLQNYGEVESDRPPMTEWTPSDIKAHIEFQQVLNQELTELGELVDAQGLAGPEQAKFVVSDGTGAPVITDGPYPESKELLAGYRMVDVETAERAIEIAAKASAAPGPERCPDPPADRGARGAERSRSRGVTSGAVVRRYGDFAGAEDAVQEGDDRQPDGDAQQGRRRRDGSRAERWARAASDGLGDRLGDHHRLHSVRAHLLELAGDPTAAIAELRAAATRTTNLREQHYLTTKAASLASKAPDDRADSVRMTERRSQ